MYFTLTYNLDKQLKKTLSKLCTLFPDRVLPVKSSLLINNENSFGRFGMSHGWIGVFPCASYKTAIPRVRSKITIVS